ncbi:MAG: hypothetical protein LBI48_00720 [Burkholderiaceae bacterium]|jgi:hypothetical protein|nr:hypothetical protein [Burkholderiaceae bacterium]
MNHPRHDQPYISWQRRSAYAFAAYMLAASMYDTASAGLFSPHSLRYAAAALTGMREWLSGGYALCMAAMLPFIAALRRPCPPPRWTARLMCAACFAAALMWVGQTFAERHVELDLLRAQYLRQAVQAIGFMLLVGAHVNARKFAERGLDRRSAGPRESNRVPLQSLG